VRIEGFTSPVRVLDTAGQEEWGSAHYNQRYYRLAHGFLLVCDCESNYAATQDLHDCFTMIQRYRQLDEDTLVTVPIVVVYNKIDKFQKQKKHGNAQQAQDAKEDDSNSSASLPAIPLQHMINKNTWIQANKIEIVQTSAKDNINVQEAFHKLIRLVRNERIEAYKKRKQQEQDSKLKCLVQ